MVMSIAVAGKRKRTSVQISLAKLALKAHYEAVHGVWWVMLTVLVPYFQHESRCPDC